MLKNTFLHIPGVGPASERRMWEEGITHWDDFKSANNPKLTSKKLVRIGSHIETSMKHLEEKDAVFFHDSLASKHHWRMYPDFRDHAVFLDIETDGLDAYGGTITTIALYDGRSVYWYVNGKNLDNFKEDIQKYKLIITYNGKCFDIPFIETYFGIALSHAHIDLRFVLSALGYKGGLKSCEHQLGIDRGNLSGVDGYMAVLLWNEYVRKQDRKALKTLLAYNIEDVINLEKLMVEAFNRNLIDTPFPEHRIDPPDSPKVPFKPDLKTVDRLKGSLYY